MKTQTTKSTIAAIATPPGQGGVGIVRLAGPKALAIGEQVAGRNLTPRHAHLVDLKREGGEIIDSALAIYFKGPHSFTGDDVVEFQCHGGPWVLSQVLESVFSLGAEQAGPGAFTERAFLNGKVDLAQAEAISDLISATTESAAKAAMRTFRGEFSKKVSVLMEATIRLHAFVEAAIDFPEEEIDFLPVDKITLQIDELVSQVHDVLNQATQGSLLRDGLRLVLAGEPNVGKSSLFNRLVGDDLAIVTPVAGTTRDVLSEWVQIDGVPVKLLDTAGMRADTSDAIEAEGVRRAEKALQEADLVLVIIDPSRQLPAAIEALLETYSGPILKVLNKADLLAESVSDDVSLRVSAKTGEGIEALKTAIWESLGGQPATQSGAFTARQRHVAALKASLYHLNTGKTVFYETRAGELLAEELRSAHHALGEILGVRSPDDILGQIFSEFCIGK